ncbi:MAG: DUF6125 family protein [Dehalococcoidia bacterium]
MDELTDYSGPFDLEFEHSKLSKEALLRLREGYASYVRVVDGLWYLATKEKRGNDEAMAMDIEVWEKAMLFELKMITSTLNIHGDDVLTVLKYLQCNPWFALCDYEIEVKNPNHAIVIERNCPTLEALEKEGKGREELQCGQICPEIQSVRANFFNPSIEFRQVKAPPRDSADDICCQWEIVLGD